MPLLTAVDRELWVCEVPLRFLGMQVGRRMTTIRLPSGELFIHAPAPLTAALKQGLEQLGDVRFVVPASLLHGHVSMPDYQRAFPGAKLYAAPGLAARRPRVSYAGELYAAPEPEWAAEIDQALLLGHRHLTEVVFLHRPSRSLLVGDACWNSKSLGLLGRAWAGGRHVGPTPLFRRGFLDRAAAADCVRRILDWDFDRLICGHGAIVHAGGKDAFAAAYAWLGL